MEELGADAELKVRTDVLMWHSNCKTHVTFSNRSLTVAESVTYFQQLPVALPTALT